MPVANTRTSTSPARTSGAGASSKNSCSGPPRSWSLMAFTESLLSLIFRKFRPRGPITLGFTPSAGGDRFLGEAVMSIKHSKKARNVLVRCPFLDLRSGEPAACPPAEALLPSLPSPPSLDRRTPHYDGWPCGRLTEGAACSSIQIMNAASHGCGEERDGTDLHATGHSGNGGSPRHQASRSAA